MVTTLAQANPRGPGRPSKKELNARPENQCGANNQSNKPCSKTKGWGTEHPGEGRCKLHGGNTPVPTATVQLSELDDLVEQYSNDPDIFDLRKELGTLRALRDAEVEGYANEPNPILKDLRLKNISTIIAHTVRSAEKFYNMLRAHQFALTVAQAVQLRDTVKKILSEEATNLSELIAPIDPEMAEAVLMWRTRVAERLQTELVIEEQHGMSDTGQRVT